MSIPRIALTELGWNEWFDRQADCRPGQSVARVAAVDRDLWLLLDETGVFRARLAGRFHYRHPLPQDQPCVGDWTCVEKPPGDGCSLIHDRIARRSHLR